MWLGWREEKEKLMHDLLWWNERQRKIGNEMGNWGNFKKLENSRKQCQTLCIRIKKQLKAAGEESKILEPHDFLLVST